jgi:hypothetical protein
MEINDEEDGVILSANSLSASAANVPDGAGGTHVVPAYSTIVDISYAASATNRAVVIGTSGQKQYDNVIVEGARRGAVVTLSYADNSFQAGWSSADKSAYIAGATGDAQYADAVNQSDKNALCDQKRSSDGRLSRVFTHHLVKDDWDGHVTYPGESAVQCFPKLDADGVPITPEEDPDIWRTGLRIESSIPLHEGWNYDNPSSPVVSSSSVTDKHFQRPFAVLVVKTDADPTKNVVEMVDHFGARSTAESEEASGLEFNCSLSVYEADAGIIVRPSTVPHVLAKGETITNTSHKTDRKSVV